MLENTSDASKHLRSPRRRNGKKAGSTEIVPVANVPPGAVLLDEHAAFVRRYVVMADAQRDVLAAWNLHTHLVDQFSVTPYMHIHSAERGCGKTLLLEVEELLCNNPLFSSGISTAALVRSLKEKPTLLLDEMDAAFGADKERAATLRGVLNSGYKHNGVYRLCVGEGAKMRVDKLPTYSAKMFAGIGRTKSLPDTVRDRSIPLNLERCSPDDVFEPFFTNEAAVLAKPLRDATSEWTGSNADAILASIKELYNHRSDDPVLSKLQPRAFEIWVCLVAICDVAGASWPQRIRAAVSELALGEDAEDRSIRERLLANIYSVFMREDVGTPLKEPEEYIESVELAHRLNANKDWEWSEWRNRRDSGITPRSIAALLKDFRIYPRTIRVDSCSTITGYRSEGFAKVWRQYGIPRAGCEDRTHPTQSNNHADPRSDSDPTLDGVVGDEESSSNTDEIENVGDVWDEPPDGTIIARAARARYLDLAAAYVDGDVDTPPKPNHHAADTELAQKISGWSKSGYDVRPTGGLHFDIYRYGRLIANSIDPDGTIASDQRWRHAAVGTTNFEDQWQDPNGEEPF
jgi:Protein of unknown function (DUF3631)